MTRINAVPIEELTLQHAMAEYRELPRALRRAVLAAYHDKTPADIAIAAEYRLGKGHELFFVDKGAWLYQRWHQLRDRLLANGYQLGDQFTMIVKGRARYLRRHARQFYGTYTPADAAQLISRQRIAERLGA